MQRLVMPCLQRNRFVEPLNPLLNLLRFDFTPMKSNLRRGRQVALAACWLLNGSAQVLHGFPQLKLVAFVIHDVNEFPVIK